jgi:hypoxanthine phosphoribosyltransferase
MTDNQQVLSTPKIKEIFSAKQIQARIAEMGAEISAEYKNLETPVVIGVMKGAFCFLADLVRHIDITHNLQIEFVRLSSYGGATESSGKVQAPWLDLPNIYHRHILVVEDIVDSGRTARFFLDYLKDQYAPTTLKLAAFLDKPSRRIVKIDPDYTGFEISDLFVVGYGLDYAEKYRELPFLGEVVSVPSDAE